MAMKTYLIMTLLMFCNILTFGQNIKDYFIPKTPFNRADFYKPGKNGERTQFTRTIIYEKEDSHYVFADVMMYNDNPTAIQILSLVLTSNEVKMIESTVTNVSVTKKVTKYDSPRTILKMPPTGQTTKWKYTDTNGEVINCTSSWTSATIDGVSTKAIKLIKEIEGVSWGKSIEYYVQGIGLWNTEQLKSDGSSQLSIKFDMLIDTSKL